MAEVSAVSPAPFHATREEIDGAGLSVERVTFRSLIQDVRDALSFHRTGTNDDAALTSPPAAVRPAGS